MVSEKAYRYVMFCAIWYYLCNLKNVQNTHGGVLLLVTKSNTPPWVIFTFLKLYKWYQIAQYITYYKAVADSGILVFWILITKILHFLVINIWSINYLYCDNCLTVPFVWISMDCFDISFLVYRNTIIAWLFWMIWISYFRSDFCRPFCWKKIKTFFAVQHWITAFRY